MRNTLVHRRRSLAAALVLSIPTLCVNADDLSRLPDRWQGQLLPVAETDLGGAERLMREAVPEARSQVAEMLSAAEPNPSALAGAYGRLGALLLLLEIEAQADVCFRNARTLQPDDFRWPYYGGYLAMMAGNTDQALEQLKAAEAIDDTYPTLYLRLGKVHLDRSELSEARAALEQIQDTPGLAAAANYYLGQIAVMQRRFGDAVTRLEKALEANPDAHEVHYPLGQAYRALGEDAVAREHLSRFRQREPEAKDPLLDELRGAVKRSLPAFQKAIHAIREGDYARAAEYFADGLEIDPENVRARVSHARALYLAGRTEQAEDALDLALAANPDLALAHFLRGVLHQERQDADNAAERYRRTLVLDPRHPGAIFYLANLDYAAGNYRAAASGYAAALAGDAEIPPARLMEVVSRYRTGSDEKEILSTIAQLAQRHPEDMPLQYALTRLLAVARDPALRQPEQALELANRMAMMHPSPAHQRLQTLALASAGDFEQAARIQRRLIPASTWAVSETERELMQYELSAFERRELPADPWPQGDPLLSPPPFDPVAPFRDYPAPVPY